VKNKLFNISLAVILSTAIISGANYFSAQATNGGYFDYGIFRGSATFKTPIIATSGSGVGSGTVQTVAGQALTVKTTVSGTAGAAGGQMSITSAAGAAATGTTAGGAGAPIVVTTGTGGAKTTTGSAVGGAGGSYTVNIGAGGNTASSSADAGGAAGTYTISGAAGGNATAGTGNGGDGTDIILTPGAGGTSSGGTVGRPGNVITSRAVVEKHTSAAVNTTATATVAQMLSGYITSTSAATVSVTLPTATNMATALNSAGAGTTFDFYVDNTAGSNTVTVAVGSGIVVAKQTGTGLTGDDQLLTVAASATVGVGHFQLVFTSTSAAVLFRIS
jgi:hypothetical protein